MSERPLAANQISQPEARPGLWVAAPWSGYGSHYWTIQRFNPSWRSRIEIGMTKAFNPRRFASEAAAKKAAEAANSEATTGENS